MEIEPVTRNTQLVTRNSRNKGFTYMEVLIAGVLISVFIIAFTKGFSSVHGGITDLKYRRKAVIIARGELERLRYFFDNPGIYAWGNEFTDTGVPPDPITLNTPVPVNRVYNGGYTGISYGGGINGTDGFYATNDDRNLVYAKLIGMDWFNEIILDDKGNSDPGDDLWGKIGWWVEDDGNKKKITFALAWRNPSWDDETEDEVIALQTIFR